ncbi:type IV secretion system protein, partial [Acidithiobacillus caldus]|uniref:type IV secretion system protein n=1 Tax=Acidithiobacillus caldus TaxID=33059 RepID=UPI0007D8DB2D
SVLLYSSQWVPWIIGGFKNVATDAGGVPVTTLGDIVLTGIKAFVTCINAPMAAAAHDAGTVLSDLWNWNLSGAFNSAIKTVAAANPASMLVGLLVGLIVGVVLIMAFGYLALELLTVQLEGMIIFSLGVIMLGFGAARWTARFVESYLQYALAIGVRLMVLTLWASFIEWQVDPLIKNTLIQGNASLKAYGIVLILAMLIALLTKKLPSFANSILTGSSALSGNEMFEAVKGGVIAAGTAVAGAATLGAGAVAGIGAAGAGAAGALGASEAAAGGAAGASAAEGAGAAGELSAAGGEAGASGVAAPDSAASAGSGSGDTSGVQPPKASGGDAGSGSRGGVQPPKSAGDSAAGNAPQESAGTPLSGSGEASGDTSVAADTTTAQGSGSDSQVGTQSQTEAPTGEAQAPTSGAQGAPSSAPESTKAGGAQAPSSGGTSDASGAPDAQAPTSDPASSG